jgi:hypothetical protein
VVGRWEVVQVLVCLALESSLDEWAVTEEEVVQTRRFPSPEAETPLL